VSGNATRDATPNTYTVTFNKDVSKCSFTASPQGDSTVEAPASRPAGPRADHREGGLRGRHRPVPPAGHLLIRRDGASAAPGRARATRRGPVRGLTGISL
jgi:hypothetical protein